MFRIQYLLNFPGNCIDLGRDELKQKVKTGNSETMKGLHTCTLFCKQLDLF